MADAREYGKALFLLAIEENKLEKIKTDVECLKAVIDENPDFIKLLDTPALPKAEKLEVIDKALASVDEYAGNLVKMLSEHHSAYLLPSALKAFLASYDEHVGIERVEAVSALPLSESQTAKLKGRLEELTGKQIIIRNTVDPTILGGIKLRYMGIQLDGSLKTKLDRFEKSLKEIVI